MLEVYEKEIEELKIEMEKAEKFSREALNTRPRIKSFSLGWPRPISLPETSLPSWRRTGRCWRAIRAWTLRPTISPP